MTYTNQKVKNKDGILAHQHLGDMVVKEELAKEMENEQSGK